MTRIRTVIEERFSKLLTRIRTGKKKGCLIY